MSATKQKKTTKTATRNGKLARISKLAASLCDGEQQSVLNVMARHIKAKRDLISPPKPSLKTARDAWSALMAAAGRIEASIEAASALTGVAANANAAIDDQTTIALDVILGRADTDFKAALAEIHNLRSFLDVVAEAETPKPTGKKTK